MVRTSLRCIESQSNQPGFLASPKPTMDMDMEIDPEIAAAMGFASFGGSKKRKFGADDAFTNAEPTGGKAQDSQQVASKANAVPVAQARSRPAEVPAAGKLPHSMLVLVVQQNAKLACRQRARHDQAGGWDLDESPGTPSWHSQ